MKIFGRDWVIAVVLPTKAMSQFPLIPDLDGGMLLEGLNANGASYEQFVFPTSRERVTIRNCSFVNCGTTIGTCQIDSGTRIENVVFENFACGDAIHIDRSVHLSNLIIRGKKPSKVIVKPTGIEGETFADHSADSIALDISGYQGDVEILGLPATSVRHNPERHFCVHGKWDERSGEWRAAGVGSLSYLGICLKKVTLGSHECGFFGLPKPRSKLYEEVKTEIQILSDKLGLSFG
ncbi:hypothetical protein NZK35_11065 [Stieleria sp. ICT_E10.1]|uniref:hypothetical protein n=1 Tax=Stieleria sedimenti TaxID=2976331 RepID=UPI00217F54EE|nr:hypothetical protein [Stieleria sedimenti]MCS7467183.1 hypothetical protein [Stieleria sedimenti]